MKKDVYLKLVAAIEAYKTMRADGRAFWRRGVATPERDVLELLLDVAAREGCNPQSGNIAGALDVWIAEELRLAGFDREAIWPRYDAPQVLDPSITSFLSWLPSSTSKPCLERIHTYPGSEARVLGAAFSKQVDVGMATWPSGPELLVSTKTMSGSFGKNWTNRFEEAYGDVKNLKSRHPLAVTGFVMLLHEDVLSDAGNLSRIVSMLQKLQSEDDAYDVVGLILATWDEQSGAELSSSLADRMYDVDLSIETFFHRVCNLLLERSVAGGHEEVRERCRDSLNCAIN